MRLNAEDLAMSINLDDNKVFICFVLPTEEQAEALLNSIIAGLRSGQLVIEPPADGIEFIEKRDAH